MKVLILTADSNGCYPVPASKGGAVSTLVEHLVAGNNKKQLCDMTVITYYDPEAYKKAKYYPNVCFYWIKIPGIIRFLDKCIFTIIKLIKNVKAISFKTPFSLLYYIIKVKNIVNKTDVDKIVLENNILLARVLKNTQFKGKWYYHFHNIPRIDGGCRDIIKNTKKLLCVSKYLGREISSDRSRIGKIPKEKIVTLYNCIDTEHFKPIDKSDKKLICFREKYKIKKDDFVVVFTGRLNEEKGPDVLLSAMKRLPDNVKALIVGSFMYNANVITEYQKILYNMAKELAERVVFTGYIQQIELPYIYNLADVAVLPSMWEEPAGLTNIEAMACGIPVITTEAGGIPEYVGESIIIKRDNQIIDNIVIQITELITNKEKRILLSEYSKTYAKKNFSNENYIDRFINAIK